MIQVTLTFNSIAAAVAALAKIPEADAAFAKAAPVSTAVDQSTDLTRLPAVSPEEKAAVLGNAPPAPSSAAPTAPSPRTAAAAPSPNAPSPAAPAPAPTATQPAATASSASAEGEFKYETLQKAVNAAVPKHGKDALLAIAKRHGADNFKVLPANKWAEAHADVLALGV